MTNYKNAKRNIVNLYSMNYTITRGNLSKLCTYFYLRVKKKITMGLPTRFRYLIIITGRYRVDKR